MIKKFDIFWCKWLGLDLFFVNPAAASRMVFLQNDGSQTRT
jgi:hypothetical protein